MVVDRIFTPSHKLKVHKKKKGIQAGSISSEVMFSFDVNTLPGCFIGNVMGPDISVGMDIALL